MQTHAVCAIAQGVDFFSATVTLLLVMDPLGNIPNFMVAVKCVPESRRLKVIARELLFALGILLAVFFAGRPAMKVLHLTEEALRIAGGIILFLIALHMIFPNKGKDATEESQEEPFIVPMATPLIAGPSVMATLMLMVGGEPQKRHIWLGAMFAAWVVNSTVLLSAPFLAKILRPRGLAAVERLMGMILVVVAVQMFLDGLHLTPAQ
jgi:multiple antibiotic resistance protein